MAVRTFSGTTNALWSLAGNWDVKPVAGDSFTINADCTLDEDGASGLAGGTINSGKTLTMSAGFKLASMTASLTVTGTLIAGAGCEITFNTAGDIYGVTGAGKQTLTGTYASPILIDNVGAGNLYGRWGPGSVWKHVRWLKAWPYDSTGRDVVWEMVEIGSRWSAWQGNGEPGPAYLRGAWIWGSVDWYLPAGPHDFENVVVGYKRDGAASAVTRAFVPNLGSIYLNGWIGNVTTIFGADYANGVFIDNYGFVDPAMLPGTASALDSAQGNPGKWYYAPAEGLMERSTSAAKANTYGARFTPGASAHTSRRLRVCAEVPIASGDNISVSVYARRSGISTTCASVRIDPAQMWFTTSESAQALTSTATWYELTASASTARGSGQVGSVRVWLEVNEYAASQTVDFADMVITVGSTAYNFTQMRAVRGVLVPDVPAAGGGGLLTHPGMTGGIRG